MDFGSTIMHRFRAYVTQKKRRRQQSTIAKARLSLLYVSTSKQASKYVRAATSSTIPATLMFHSAATTLFLLLDMHNSAPALDSS
jgi:hypothetical protein